MCYSALVWSDYRTYVRDFNARISIKEFYDLFYRRLSDPKIVVPKAMEAWFSTPTNDDEQQVKELIDRFAAQQQLKFEQLAGIGFRPGNGTAWIIRPGLAVSGLVLAFASGSFGSEVLQVIAAIFGGLMFLAAILMTFRQRWSQAVKARLSRVTALRSL